jgi:predicted Rossmann fold nucleotide-binding protein DprA/Smf involved in DNA uptake
MVATTPASVIDIHFAGNTQLLKDGALMVTEPEDILQILGLQNMVTPRRSQIVFSSDKESEVFSQLDLENSIDVVTLAQTLNLQTVEVTMHLTMLELHGLVKHLGENRWVRSM